jgi:Thermopsin
MFFPKETRLDDVEPISGFSPAGITSYGSNGTLVRTNSVEGITKIGEIGVGYFSALIVNSINSTNDYVNGTLYNGYSSASLQENAVLWLGNLGTYWTQNVILLTQVSRGSYIVEPVDNIWNFSSGVANMHQNAISGNGNVECTTVTGEGTSCAYVTSGANLTVTAPFTIKLIMTIGGGNGAASVEFQYQIQESSGGNNAPVEYDNAILYPGNPTVPAYFQIGGESPVVDDLGGGTSFTLPSDLELVFGGPGGGSGVFVNSVVGSQELMYSNGVTYLPVPDAFSAGSDTAEQAAGIQVTGDLTNHSLPTGMLSSGVVTTQKLWPLPLALTLAGSNDFSNGSLNIQGVLVYSLGNSSFAPGSNLPVLESLSGTSESTGAGGGFSFLFQPTHTGVYLDTISYAGSVAFSPETFAPIQIAVSSITISGTSGGAVIGDFNSSQIVIQSKASVLVPVLQGSFLVITFQNTTNIGNQREQFLGFGSSSGHSLVLNGNSAQSVTANFQQILALGISVDLFYGLIAAVALIVGLVLGYVLRGRKWTASTSTPGPTTTTTETSPDQQPVPGPGTMSAK